MAKPLLVFINPDLVLMNSSSAIMTSSMDSSAMMTSTSDIISKTMIFYDNRYDILLEWEEKGIDVSREFPQFFLKSFEKYKEILQRTQIRAQKKIYFWWIPICYSLDHPSGCGKRMALKNLQKFQELCMSSN